MVAQSPLASCEITWCKLNLSLLSTIFQLNLSSYLGHESTIVHLQMRRKKERMPMFNLLIISLKMFMSWWFQTPLASPCPLPLRLEHITDFLVQKNNVNVITNLSSARSEIPTSQLALPPSLRLEQVSYFLVPKKKIKTKVNDPKPNINDPMPIAMHKSRPSGAFF